MVEDGGLVGVEAGSCFTAESPSAHHFAQQRVSTVFCISGFFFQNVHDGQAHIQTNQVAQFQGAHRVAGAQFHGGVYTFHGGNTFSIYSDCLIDHRYENTVNHKAGSFQHDHRGFAQVVGNLADLFYQFAALDAIAKSDCLFATNSSSLSITEIGQGLSRPLIGMHFFNPVPVMKLVEVIPGLNTPPELVEKAIRFGDGI